MKISRSLSPPYLGMGVTEATDFMKVLGVDEDGSLSITRCTTLEIPCLMRSLNSPYRSKLVVWPVGLRLGSLVTLRADESCRQS